ncbi:hypothetical protein DF186_18160 [Enterococcus hirae]|nr:hypothetical protein DF186_18160 [Enterococcus hirae]
MKAELFIQSSLIIWDEVLMFNKMCFERFDRIIRDFMLIIY